MEDSKESAYILRELLERHGLKVRICDRAKAALELCKSEGNSIDLVITDLRMPEMSGQALILEVRKYEEQENRRRVPIIVLTGEAAPSEKIACLSHLGADDFLLKPLKINDLLASIERILSRHHAKKHKNVLVIDDDVLSRKIISSLLTRGGDRCTECSSIADVLISACIS